MEEHHVAARWTLSRARLAQQLIHYNPDTTFFPTLVPPEANFRGVERLFARFRVGHRVGFDFPSRDFY